MGLNYIRNDTKMYFFKGFCTYSDKNKAETAVSVWSKLLQVLKDLEMSVSAEISGVVYVRPSVASYAWYCFINIAVLTACRYAAA